MGKGSKPKLPDYEEMAPNAYTNANRQLSVTLGNWLLDNYQNIGSVSQDQEQEYLDIANKASESAWNDFNRDLAKAQSTRNARSYNRYGSLTNTPSLYEQESFGREANKAALELANNITNYYNNLVNEDINRQLTSWNQYSNMYNTAGADINKFDTYNWDIRNKNKDRQYTNDLQAFNDRMAKINAINSIGGSIGKGLPGILSNLNNGNFDSLINQNNSFLNNNGFLSSFGQDKNSFINSLNGRGMFDDINSTFGSSGRSAGSNSGSFFSSIADLFKGFGGGF